MTDKPDALAELKTVREGCYHSTNFATIDVHRIEGAIAAWEKERAELRYLRHERGQDTLRHTALRAAVEKVRDELRRATDGADMDPDEYTHGLVDCNVTRAHADALDAALRGDA